MPFDHKNILISTGIGGGYSSGYRGPIERTAPPEVIPPKPEPLPPGQISADEYSAMNREQRRQARNDGQLNHLLGAPIDPGDEQLSPEQYSALTRDQRRQARADGRVDHHLTNNN